MRGVATLEEIETHYDLLDLIQANEALDIMDELEDLQSEKLKQKNGSSREGWR